MPQYWYNVNNHQVEVDAQSGWKELIGPYETREEAEHAMEQVQKNNEAADSFDRDSAAGDN